MKKITKKKNRINSIVNSTSKKLNIIVVKNAITFL